MTDRPKIRWPATGEELKAAGYVSDGKRSRCRGCQEAIVWVTTPNGKKQPLQQITATQWDPHHAHCKAVDRFKKPKVAS